MTKKKAAPETTAKKRPANRSTMAGLEGGGSQRVKLAWARLGVDSEKTESVFLRDMAFSMSVKAHAMEDLAGVVDTLELEADMPRGSLGEGLPETDAKIANDVPSILRALEGVGVGWAGVLNLDDRLIASVDRPPRLPFFVRGYDYFWDAQGRGGVFYTVHVRARPAASAASAPEDKYQMDGPFVRVSIGAVEEGDRGGASLEGVVSFDGEASLVSLKETEEGASLDVLSLWCRLVNAYGIRRWEAWQLDADGFALVRAYLRRGLARAVSVGPPVLLGCAAAGGDQGELMALPRFVPVRRAGRAWQLFDGLSAELYPAQFNSEEAAERQASALHAALPKSQRAGYGDRV